LQLKFFFFYRQLSLFKILNVDEDVTQVFSKVLEEGEQCLLILAPRHPERCRTVRDMLEKPGFLVVLRNQIDEVDAPLQSGHILLIGTIGELVKFYALADLVFVGGVWSKSVGTISWKPRRSASRSCLVPIWLISRR
jgi:3-deoxy-D-manno-octulosonic-acid transferase